MLALQGSAGQEGNCSLRVIIFSSEQDGQGTWQRIGFSRRVFKRKAVLKNPLRIFGFISHVPLFTIARRYQITVRRDFFLQPAQNRRIGVWGGERCYGGNPARRTLAAIFVDQYLLAWNKPDKLIGGKIA